MICAIHQPNFIPYLGFFQKFKQSDIFVLYDIAQYSKNDFHNRNQIKTANGAAWLSIPVNVHLGQTVAEALVAQTDFQQKHLKTLEVNYKKAPFFQELFPQLVSLYHEPSLKLIDINMRLLRFVFNLFDPKKKVVLASELEWNKVTKSTDALVEILATVKADTYLSGVGARKYLDEKIFETHGISLQWQEFSHPTYPQQWGEFIVNLSVLDALFNIGPEKTYSLI